jgi:hypothetical protein
MSFFQEGDFDTLEFTIPVAGMNQNISPKILPPQYAYVLDNIVPLPIGRGSVRYGTKLVNEDLTFDSNIIEIFPFLNNDGTEQDILYVADFVEDTTANTFIVTSVSRFYFSSTNGALYFQDTQIKIRYHTSTFATTTMYCNIFAVLTDEETVIVELSGNYFIDDIDDITIDSVWFPVGNIYMYNTETSTLSAPLNTNYMSVACVPRAITFQNTLTICNGVDKLVIWDGTDLNIVTDYVTEYANSFIRISNSSFSFIPTVGLNIPDFILGKYPVGGLIRLNVYNGNVLVSSTNLTILTATQAGNVVTITTTTATVPAFTGVNNLALAYGDYPPTFNFLFVAHNRIWALGPGQASINYREFSETMIVYYTYETNNPLKWFNDQNKRVEFEDLRNQHGIADNLEAIASISNYIVFIGRHKTQVWQGIDPTTLAAAPNRFSWAYNLDIGIAHGNLALDIATDTYLVTDNGIVSLSRFNITQQIGATDVNSVDPIVRDYLQTIKQSNIFYRQCRSFKYKNGPFCGFKIGTNKILVSLYSTNLYSWMFFSGDFANASTIVSGSIDSLYLGIGNKLYKYADGKDGDVVLYGDQNGTALISFFWTLPVVHRPGIRFANKRYEIQLEYGSAFARNQQDNLSIGVIGDIRQSFELRNLYALPPIGDALNTVPLGLGVPNPTNPDPNAPGLRLETSYSYPKGRLKFVSSSFWLYLTGYTVDGPIYFDRIRLFGITERRS